MRIGANQEMRRACVLARGIFIFLAATVVAAEHPFILWTKDDLAALRAKIEREPWTRAAAARIDAEKDPTVGLLRAAALGDAKATEVEKKELLRMVRSPRPQGAAQEINVLRYDLLHDQLAVDERREVEACFRAYIEDHVVKRAIFDPAVFNNSRNYARYDARKYGRANWLPNIIWPWKVSGNLMAAALADEKLIRDTWAAYGSMKWYFDEYLCDIGFYSEEFSKMGSTPGAMLLYCLAVERLGLDELGFGYKGKGGATMRGHIESLIHLGYPRVDIGSARPHYPMVTIGDLRQSGSSQDWNLPSAAFQHALVMGYTPDGKGGNLRWKAHGAWGGTMRGKNPQWDGYGGFTPKMQVPLWFELGHKRWPESGFGYFLAAMRRPDDERYIPSLLFGIEPIDPAAVKPPPAPSAVWPERGLVMLRAEESPACWESPAPAVCMRLASDYAHNVHDAFALAGFYAFNRPLYLNRQSVPSYAQGWSRSIQSHCGVMVDGREPRFTSATAVRNAFTPLVKFVIASSKQVYPDVDLTRSLMLMREYLLDFTSLSSGQPRRYAWLIHGLGVAKAPDPTQWKEAKPPEGLTGLEEVRASDPGESPWWLTLLQACTLPDPAKAQLPAAWFERQVGVRLGLLGEKGTLAYAARTPLLIRETRDPHGIRKQEEQPSEAGGVTVAVTRTVPATVFAALHEPFEKAKYRIAEFRRIEQTAEGLAVAIAGAGINDRAMLRLGDDADKPLTLAGDGESFAFADFAFIRIGTDRVEACGGLRAMTLRVEGRPKLLLNGKEEPAAIEGGLLTFRK